MKIVFYFVMLYFILIGSIFSFYVDLLSDYNNALKSTKNKIEGVSYLKLLHKLSVELSMHRGCMVVDDKTEDKDKIEQNIKSTTKEIYNFTKIHTKFYSATFNKYLKDIEEFKVNCNDYFDYLDYINHENYIVGNSAEILFSKDKQRYFLGTLMTHYIPEFVISLGIVHNILEELALKKPINDSKKSIFIEQKKLIYLSSNELFNIAKLLSEYDDSKEIYNITVKIQNILKKNRDNAIILNNYTKDVNKYLKISDELLDLSESLNIENTKLLERLLKNDEKNLSDKIIFYSLLLVFMIILVTAIFIYFFRIFNLNIKKDRELEELNKSLIQRVKQEVAQNRKKDQQMIEQSRLAQMGEMISMIAHQWRQPLSAISATSVSLEVKAHLGKIDKDTVTKAAKNISKYSQHLSTTIDDFRDFFKTNKDKKNSTYNELIESVLSIIEVSITNKNIELVQILNSQSTFFTYPNEIRQVILNLIKNAEDILLQREIKNPKITIETVCGVLTVSDNAGGISEDIIEKVFDPYFSTKLDTNGTGLGLYMSKTIIEDHCRGRLSVSNDENGAVFKIVLKEIP